jgi:hypothetical protein
MLTQSTEAIGTLTLDPGIIVAPSLDILRAIRAEQSYIAGIALGIIGKDRLVDAAIADRLSLDRGTIEAAHRKIVKEERILAGPRISAWCKGPNFYPLSLGEKSMMATVWDITADTVETLPQDRRRRWFNSYVMSGIND